MSRAIPKLVVDGGNDEFMLPDDNHAWWDDLPVRHVISHCAVCRAFSSNHRTIFSD